MTRLIVALAGCIAAAGASAADHVVLHGLSSHSGTRQDGKPYQEQNIGAGWRRTYGQTWAAQAGLYQNSYNRLSVYGLGEWTPLRAGQVSAGLFAGLASGYSHGFTAGGFVARWQGDRLGVAVRYMPDVSEKVRGSVTTVEASWMVNG